jgi:hypothetical protein
MNAKAITAHVRKLIEPFPALTILTIPHAALS